MNFMVLIFPLLVGLSVNHHNGVTPAPATFEEAKVSIEKAIEEGLEGPVMTQEVYNERVND